MTQIYDKKPFNKGWTGYSPDELAARLDEALITEQGNRQEEQKYSEYLKQQHPERYQYDSGINQALTNNTISMVNAINSDPRTRRRDEKSEAVNLRRTKTYMEDLAKEEAKLTDSAKIYEKRIFDSLEQMNLGREYTQSIPHWMRDMEENEE